MLVHGFDRLCNRNQCLRLTKWFAAGEGHTGQQRILSDALQDLLHISNMAACKMEEPGVQRLLELADVLVDGPFLMAERNLTLQYRGSENQRVIDLAKTRAAGEIIL